jgi:uncharacterized membrane protein YphA (DoxX/SURF4 family)
MQRLFSIFPGGWPGCGLLLLRLLCSAPLLVIGTSKFWGSPVDAALWIRVASFITGALLLIGLWTPFAAACQALLYALLTFAGKVFEPIYLILALIGLSLLMLGPGTWSIDARLYGRKRIDLGSTSRK